MGKVDLVRFDSAEALAQAAAREWLQSITQPQHYAAFSGGRIAGQFFDAITAEVRRSKITLNGVHFFLADERCVPPDNADSNYALMETRLLRPLDIDRAQVHRIKGELEPRAAAREATAEFSAIVRSVLDFVFLGMGEDGHIASIFPGDAAKESPVEFYRAITNAPKPPPDRVTLAMPSMVVARNAYVLVSGHGKESALRKSLDGAETPLGRLLQRRPYTRVFTNI